MSLIPSESSSFADLLGRGLDGSKKSKWRAPVVEPPKLSDASKSPAGSPTLKEKPRPEQVAAKIRKPSLNKKVDPKKSSGTPKKAAPPPPASAAVKKIPPVVETELNNDKLASLMPPPAILSVESGPEPKQVTQPRPIPPPEPVHLEPVIKAPLVIQPEDEPPRRPIPIVRVARSKQDPHGNGRVVAAESNGHTFSTPEPLPSSPSPDPLAVTSPSAPPRLRPKPFMRLRAEEEQQNEPTVMPFSNERTEIPPDIRPTSPAAMSVESDSVESDPWSAEDFAWTPEPLRRPRFQIQWGSRLVRCLMYEAAAILVLLGAVLVGLAHRAPDDPLNLLTRILAIGAAIVAAVIPVLFYGLPERFPRDPR